MKVIAPYSAKDCKALLKAAIKDPNPTIFLKHELMYGKSFEIDETFDEKVEIGKAAILREGSDVTITAFSLEVGNALAAAEILANQGISAEVIDLRTLRPLDENSIINSVIKTNRLVTVEGGWGFAGIGATIAAIILEKAFDYLDSEIIRLHQKEVPLPYAANLEKMALPQIEDIVEACKKVCNK